MGIQKIVLNIVLKIEFFFLSFLQINENRITFISLESRTLTSDFKLIYNQLNPNDYDIRLCLIHYHKDLWGQFLYFLNCIQQLYLINTSKMVLIHDNNYVVSHFKKDDVQVLQIWHACGAIKKFGNAIKREYPISHYDYVLSTSSYWKRPYSEAFSVEESSVLPLGLPRNDELFKKQWICDIEEKMYQKYPQLKDKKVILYAPTFRGDIYQGFRTIPFIAKEIVESLGEDYILIYKFHPLLGDVQLDNHPQILKMNHEDTHELFCISDYLISDYSSIIFDYMILEKPILFYTPDLEEYMQDRGVFVDIYQLGYPVCQCESELVEMIKNYPVNSIRMKKNKNTFFEKQDDLSTQRIVNFIENQMKQ